MRKLFGKLRGFAGALAGILSAVIASIGLWFATTTLVRRLEDLLAANHPRSNN
jgi:hypothetical protein